MIAYLLLQQSSVIKDANTDNWRQFSIKHWFQLCSSSPPGQGHKSWGSTVSDDSVGGEGALDSPTASSSESQEQAAEQPIH